MSPGKSQSRPKIPPSDDPDVAAKINRFLETTDTLQQLLEEESRCLKQVDRQGFLDLQERKMELSIAYQENIIVLKSMSEKLKEQNTDFVKYLLTKHEDLQATMRRNQTALERAQKTAHRLSNHMLDIARQAATSKTSLTYGDKGSVAKEKRASLGLSESV